jgi:hypothetical protein
VRTGYDELAGHSDKTVSELLELGSSPLVAFIDEVLETSSMAVGAKIEDSYFF